jgi:hypothetical protein
MHTKLRLKNLNGRSHLEDLGTDERILTHFDRGS